MASIISPSDEHFTYGFAQIGLKNQVVFKSIVALLTGRTRAQWHFVDDAVPDLLVSADNAPAVAHGAEQLLLKVSGLQSPDATLHLHLPLRAGEVCGCLDAVAESIGRKRSAVHASLRLLRWPSASQLQGNVLYVRLATLLGARAMNVAELSSRSGAPLAVCEAFVLLMDQQGLLSRELPAAQASPVIAAQPGLFARIRRHIGLAFDEGAQ